MQILVSEWQDDRYDNCLHGHELYVSLEEECYKFTNEDGIVCRDEVLDLKCCHEEADSRLIFHLGRIFNTYPELAVSIRSNDTDVMVLLLYHSNVW